MIARSWDGLTKADQADEYTEYVRRTGVKDLAATSGNRGVYVLRRREGEQARFRVLSLWDSMEGDPPLRRRRPGAGPLLPGGRALPERARAQRRALRGGGGGRVRAAASEAADLARELETLAHGDAWHGPALDELLEGVSAEMAAARPIAGAHTIWEAGPASDGVDGRLPPAAGRDGHRGAGSRGLPRDAPADGRGMGRGDARRCSRRTKRSRRGCSVSPTPTSPGASRADPSTRASRRGPRSATSCTTAARSACCARARPRASARVRRRPFPGGLFGAAPASFGPRRP